MQAKSKRKPVGRPTAPPARTLAVWITDDLRDRLEQAAVRERRPLNRMIVARLDHSVKMQDFPHIERLMDRIGTLAHEVERVTGANATRDRTAFDELAAGIQELLTRMTPPVGARAPLNPAQRSQHLKARRRIMTGPSAEPGDLGRQLAHGIIVAEDIHGD